METMFMQNFGRLTKSIMVIFKVAYFCAEKRAALFFARDDTTSQFHVDNETACFYFSNLYHMSNPRENI